MRLSCPPLYLLLKNIHCSKQGLSASLEGKFIGATEERESDLFTYVQNFPSGLEISLRFEEVLGPVWYFIQLKWPCFRGYEVKTFCQKRKHTHTHRSNDVFSVLHWVIPSKKLINTHSLKPSHAHISVWLSQMLPQSPDSRRCLCLGPWLCLIVRTSVCFLFA